MILSDAAIKNKATVVVLTMLIVMAGVYSYSVLPREAEPDVPVPLVIITTAYEGVSPQDIETSVTIKIENELSGLKGMKEIRSSSSEGMSSVLVEFLPNIQIEDAKLYVRDRVDLAKPELPAAAEEPAIKEINIAEFPIMMISISGDISPVHMRNIADELKEHMQLLPGVLDVDISGDLEREIRLEIEPDRLTAYNLTIQEILQLVPSENVNISAGGIETEGTKFNVRIPAEFAKPEETNELLLSSRNRSNIFLRDVAEVRDTFKDRATYSRLDGIPSITLGIRKRIGADMIPISDSVKEILKIARTRVPANVKLEITADKAKDVRMMVSDLENNILCGLILVLIVLFLFMGWRSSFIVALAIPLSMLMTFALIMVLGYTLNMIVLFSLVLALGMLVDNAIVIVENIYRHMQQGYSRMEAALQGAREVAWPVITSTGTTVAAFFPLLFWPGVMGDFMKYLPIGVIITLTSSLFVALVISPTVCSATANAGKRGAEGDTRFVLAYRSALSFAIRHRIITLLLAVGLFAGVIALYGTLGKGVQFFPKMDPERAIINLRLPQGTNIRRTDDITRGVEERISHYVSPTGKKANQTPEMQHIVANVGSAGSANPIVQGGSSGPHVSNITLIFPDYETRARPSAEIVTEIRKALSDVSGAEIKVEAEDGGPPAGPAVTVRIAGDDFGELERISKAAKGRIADVPGLVNLRSDLETARPELEFRVDRWRAMMLGVNTAKVGAFLKTAIFGNEVGTYRQFNDEYDITVRLPFDRRTNIEDIFSLHIPNMYGQSVPLSSLGTLDYVGGFGTINRVNRKRVVTLTADAEEGRLSEKVLADVQRRLKPLEKELQNTAGYTITYAGENEEKQKAIAFLSKAFVIALLLIVMILVTQFNAFSVPIIIMTTVLLSLIGVFAGLLVFNMPFGIIMIGIGVISLAGVVVNNAIVLLAYTRQLQRRGKDVVAAALEAGRTRLRPVLLTATTTILGLVPMATGVAFDFRNFRWVTRSMSSQWWSSMSTAVIFGLAFATVLTLIVVPALYVGLYRAAALLGARGIREEL